MDPITISALIAGGSSLLGGFMSNRANAKAVAAANEQNWQLAQYNTAVNQQQSALDWERTLSGMDKAQGMTQANMSLANEMQRGQNREQEAFQERMSNTAHQREVLDLRRAGLNPVLSGTGGMGAPTGTGHAGGPSGASVAGPSARGYGASGTSFTAPRFADVLSPAVSSAVQTMQGLSNVELQSATANKTNAEAARTWHQAGLDPTYAESERKGEVDRKAEERWLTHYRSRREATASDVEKGKGEAGWLATQRAEAELDYLREQVKHQGATARSASVAADLDEDFKQLERSIGMGGGAVSALKQLLWMLRK